MDTTLRLTIVVALLIYFAFIFALLKRKKLTLKYTLLWLFAGVVMALIAIFPNIFEKLMHLIGVIEMTNGLFAVLIFAMIIIMISITVIVSEMNDRQRQLIQQCAFYEKRIRELESASEDNVSNQQ